MALWFLIAISCIGNASAQDGNEDRLARAAATFNDAQDLHEKGLIPEAIALYRKALSISEEFPEAQFQLGIALLQVGDSKEAESYLRRALELRPDWTLPILPLTRILMLDGRESEAVSLLDSGIEREPSNPALLAERAFIALDSTADATNLGRLLEKITDVTRGANSAGPAILARASLELRLGRMSEALVSVNRAVRDEPGNVNAIRLRGEIELAKEDFSSALSTADFLLSLPGSRDDAIIIKAQALIGIGRTGEGVELLNSFESLKPGLKRKASRLLARHTEDAATISRLLSIFPDDEEILFMICTSRANRSAEIVISACSRLLSLKPDRNSDALGSRAAAFLKSRRFQEALLDYESIIAVEPGNANATAGRSLALFNLGQWEAAGLSFEKLIASSSEFPVAFYYLGIIYDRLSRPLDAMKSYERFLAVADRSKMSDEIERTELRLSVLRKQSKTRKNQR